MSDCDPFVRIIGDNNADICSKPEIHSFAMEVINIYDNYSKALERTKMVRK
ncbi:MAG: hypothetical protein R2771_01835 [Saprospiraceae bacterium]